MTPDEYFASLKDKTVAVIGYGISNRPLVERLIKENVSLSVRDKREDLGADGERLNRLGVRLFLGSEYLSELTEDVIFRTPGLRPDSPEISAAVANGSELTSEMEAFFKVCPCRIFAVTGSDGKTTTTTLISELLKESGVRIHVGGNIGTPLLTKADEILPDDIAVLELSSFQLMTMRVSPQRAVITNLAPNHLDMHRDMREYVDAKRNIYLHQDTDSVLILNEDNEITASFMPEARGKLMTFSRKTAVRNGYYSEEGIVYRSENGKAEQILSESEIRIPGKHNVENFLAAFCAVDGYVSKECMRKVARDFPGVQHRIEFVRELDGVSYYNDSIASSPSRTIAGLRSFSKKVILIAGGKDKGVPFDTLAEEICTHVKKLVLTGWTAEKIRDAMTACKSYDGSPEICIVEDFTDAIKKAREFAQNGDIVLLSPACTSFDKFKNFEERGNLFKKTVKELETNG